MDNSRREFLKKLGLGGLGVAMASAPVLATVIDNSIKAKINTPEQFLNQTITAYTYKKQLRKGISTMVLDKERTRMNSDEFNSTTNFYSKWYLDKQECEYMAMINLAGGGIPKFAFQAISNDFRYYEDTIIIEEHNIPVGVYINNMFTSSNTRLSKELLFKNLEF